MFFWLAMRASITLHNNMFHSITRGTMRFFHVNPSGRILNRFSKDMGSIDELLPSACIDVLQVYIILYNTFFSLNLHKILITLFMTNFSRSVYPLLA